MTRCLVTRRLLRLGVAGLLLAVGALIYTQLLPQRGPLRWDEAVHAFKGLVIAHDLATLDGLSFLFDSYRQVLYPPLHSWLVAAAYLVAGPSVTTAITVTLALFLIGGGVLYLAGGQVRPQATINWAGAVAALLWLTSPALVEYSVQTMLEVPGLVALAVAMLVFLKLLAEPDAPPREYRLLAAAIALTYFVRTPYGIILILAVGITLLVEARGRIHHLWTARTFYLLLPLALVFAIWFAYPAKLGSTWTWLVNYPDGVDDPYSAEGWLYYPLALVRIAGSPWLLALYLAGMVYALVERRPGPRFLVILALVQVIVGEFHQNKQSRYLFPVLPAWYLLAGNLLAGAGAWLAARRPSTARWAGSLLALLLVGQSALLLNGALHKTRPARPDPLGDYVIQTLQTQGPATRTLVIGSMEMSHPTPPFLDWRLVAEQAILAAPAAGSAAQIDEGRKLAGMLARLPLPQKLAAALRRVLTGYDQPQRVRTLYLGLPRRASYSQGARPAAAFVQELIRAQQIDQVILITATRPQARYPRDLLAPGLEAAGWQRVAGATFDTLVMQVEVFRRAP